MLRHKTRRASGDSVINKDKSQFSEPTVSDDDIDSLAGDAGASESSDSNVSEIEINGKRKFLAYINSHCIKERDELFH